MYTGIDIKIVERAMNRAVCLGKNIRKYRKRKNMTQAELAEKILVSPQNVSKWENGNSLPDVPSLCMLSDVLDISIINVHIRGIILFIFSRGHAYMFFE